MGIASFHCGLSLLGPWASTVFYMLSGFVMMYSYNGKEVGHSLKSSLLFSFGKIKKLYPLYFITLVFYFFFQKVRSVKIILLNILLLQSWVPDSNVFYSMNGVAWFYSDLLFIYCMFPLVKFIIDKYKSKKPAYTVMVLITVILSALSITLKYVELPAAFPSDFSKWITYILPVSRLGDFIIGCNLGYLFINLKPKVKKLPLTLLELFSVLMLAGIQVFYYINSKNGILDYTPYLYLTSAALIIVLFTLNGGLLTNICSNKIFIFIGNLSGYAFLIHRPVTDFLYATLSEKIAPSHRLNDIVIFAVSIVITIGFSYAYSKADKAIHRKTKH